MSEISARQLIAPECPWHDAQQLFGEPNVKWCEERLCSVINEPANAWSNLAYILVALWCLWQGRAQNSRTLRQFGWTLAIVGSSSFAYHATNNFGTQLLDFMGMYVCVFLLIAMNLHRGGFIPASRITWIHAGGSILATLLILPMRAAGLPYQAIVLVGALGIIGTEFAAVRVAGRPASYRWFAGSLLFFAIALGFSISDVKGWRCDPKDHLFPGHALWHLFGAVGLLLGTLHYRQLELEAARREAT